VSHSDEYYLTWPEKTTPEEVKRYKLLQSLTEEEEIADLLCKRAIVWQENGRYSDAAFEFLAGFQRAPGREVLVNSLYRAVALWGIHLRAQIGRGFPGLVVCKQPVRHPALPMDLQVEFNYLHVLELLLNDPVKRQLWWEPLRRDPIRRPPGMPDYIRVTYPAIPGDPLRYEACDPPQPAPYKYTGASYQRYID
jgi:hypothetical protein